MSKDYINQLSPYLFWDMDRELTDMDTCPSQIIQRVLEYGTWKDWKLILSYYGLDKIVNVCRSLRTMDVKALSFICCISNTDKTEYRCYHTKQSSPNSEYSIFRALMSMTYFEDAESQIMPKMFVNVTWEEIKRFLNQAIAQASLSNQPE